MVKSEETKRCVSSARLLGKDSVLSRRFPSYFIIVFWPSMASVLISRIAIEPLPAADMSFAHAAEIDRYARKTPHT